MTQTDKITREDEAAWPIAVNKLAGVHPSAKRDLIARGPTVFFLAGRASMRKENERLRQSLQRIKSYAWVEVEPHREDVPDDIEPWVQELEHFSEFAAKESTQALADKDKP